MREPTVRVVLHPVHGPGLAEALERLPGIDLTVADTDDEVVAALADGAPVLVTFPWNDRFLTPGLRWVQVISTGVEHVPVELLRHRGVVVTTARGAQAPSVAEHAVALVLALLRGVGPAIRQSARRQWILPPATELAGTTVVVLGFGSIGTEVGRRLRALGARVVGVRRTPEPSDGADVVVGPDALHRVLAEASIVVCALPGGPETAGVIGTEELEALGDGWLVNVGRGSVVDEAALVDALTRGELRGAALDVTAVEPLPGDSPLWDLENVVVTPHMGWVSDHLASRVAAVFESNLAAYLGRGRWSNRIA